MNLQARPYQDPADVVPMKQLLIIGSRSQTPASYMHPGILDWAIYYPPDEVANRRNLRLWQDQDTTPPTLLAWAIFFTHEDTFDLFVHPSIYDTPIHERVMDEYVTWAKGRAQEAGLSQLSPFWVYDYDKVTDRLLQTYGFVPIPADPPAPLFERSLEELPTMPLPAGFTIQGVKSLDDGRLRAAVTHGAFRRQDDWEHYWAEYAQFVGSAAYEGERDLFVRSPDGRGAAACTIWFDPVNKVGLFEPVATHPDFQRLGLGKAVMAEGMRRMKAAGMERAILGFDPNNAPARALYTSLGFRTACNFAFYSKKL
ncbi:MAG: GNAT family N-acetyltransferase [Caldilineaceae bacterium]